MRRIKQGVFGLLTIALLFVMFVPQAVSAATDGLHSIGSTAIIQDDGSVRIRQEWEYDDRTSGGTEHYINLNAQYSEDGIYGDEESISDYRVSRNGEPMEYLSNWDVDASFEAKAGRYGVVDLGDEIELMFGISAYSENSFVVEYLVHNAIKETTDGAKYLHWSFIPTGLEPEPQALSAIIETVNSEVTIDKVFGFNYEGVIEFGDMDVKDLVKAEMTGRYTPDTALNIFVSLNDESNVISNTQMVDQTLDEKVETMFVDSDYSIEDYYADQEQSSESVNEKFGIGSVLSMIVGGLFAIIGFILSNIFFIVMLVLVGRPLYRLTQERSNLLSSMSKEDIKTVTKDKDFYRRDEPQVEIEFYPILDTIIGFNQSEENVIMYYVSKWTSDDVFEYLREVQPDKPGVFKKKKPSILFQLHPDKIDKNVPEIEKDMFNVFLRLSDNDHILNTNDLSKIDVGKIEKILRDHKKSSQEYLLKENYLEKDGRKTVLSTKGIRALENHIGLKNYLTDYTLINEREASEIQLWEFFFRLAALYGVTEAFRSQLDKLPNLDGQNEQMYNQYYGMSGTARMNYLIATNVHRNLERQRQVREQQRRSSGSGGSSSMGGGGGFSGGGSGGGTR